MGDDRTRDATPYHNPIPTADYTPAPTLDPESTQPPSREPGAPLAGLADVPGYEVTGEIARGGMGRVLAARDVALDRPVAVKVVLPGCGPAAALRFVREARITGRLTHPGIPPARHLGRLADGSPFLAMKLIRGDTLADRLRARPSPAHDLPRLVGVFEQVCQAVGFAHSEGVIHRDLKPANVMVGAFGEVQVMDWGLAFEKDEGGGMKDESNTAGVRDSSFIPPPSSLTQAGAVMGTPAYMAPEQARGEDVDARADVFALGGILYEILTGARPFAGQTGTEALARAALAGCAAATAAKDFLQRVLTQASAHWPSTRVRQSDPNLTLAAALVRAAGEVGGAFPDQPRIEADLRQTIGIALIGLGRYADAEPHLAAALALHERTLGADDPDTLTSAYYLGEAKLFSGRTAEAEPLLRRALDGRTRVLGPAHPDTFDAVNDVAILCTNSGRFEEAEALLVPALPAATAALGPDHPAALVLTGALGQLRADQGRHAEAGQLLGRSLAGRERTFGPDHPNTCEAVYSLGTLRLAEGRPADARALLERAVDGFEKAVGPGHPYVGAGLNALGRAADDAGRPADAERCFRSSLETAERVHGRDAPHTLSPLANLAAWLLGRDRPADAERLLLRVVEAAHRHFGATDPFTLTAESNRAAVYAALRRADDSRGLFRRALAGREKALPPDHPDTLVVVRALAQAEMKAGRHAAAEPLWRRYPSAADRTDPSALGTATARFRLGEVLFALERYDEAEGWLIRGFRDTPAAGATREHLRDAAGRVGAGYYLVRRYADAARWAAERAKYPEIAPPPRPVQ